MTLTTRMLPGWNGWACLWLWGTGPGTGLVSAGLRFGAEIELQRQQLDALSRELGEGAELEQQFRDRSSPEPAAGLQAGEPPGGGSRRRNRRPACCVNCKRRQWSRD